MTEPSTVAQPAVAPRWTHQRKVLTLLWTILGVAVLTLGMAVFATTSLIAQAAQTKHEQKVSACDKYDPSSLDYWACVSDS